MLRSSSPSLHGAACRCRNVFLPLEYLHALEQLSKRDELVFPDVDSLLTWLRSTFT